MEELVTDPLEEVIDGMNSMDAAVSGAQTLGSSMLNGTLTTFAAFVPMLIAMDGVNREFIIGIVLNAAILFVEFGDMSVAERSAGGQPETAAGKKEIFHSAIVAAGQQRLTAISLTTATTVGGLIPLAIAGGPLWEGMVWLLVSGLSFATLLTLIVVPVLYSLKKT